MSLKRKTPQDSDELYVRWQLSSSGQERLMKKRQRKYLKLSRAACRDSRPLLGKMAAAAADMWLHSFYRLKYDIYRKHKRSIDYTLEEIGAEYEALKSRMLYPWRKLVGALPMGNAATENATRELTTLSDWDEDSQRSGKWAYISPRAKKDRAVTCPNTAKYGCMDLWGPDLFGEFAGVCPNCGHHFPMEYQWYVNNVFDEGSVFEFNSELEAANPLQFPGFGAKLEEAQKKTGLKSGCVTFEARIDGIKMVIAMLVGSFRGGSVGAAEGEKFLEAAELARKKHYPFLAYVHGTAGIRIQEGTNGVIQMPRCTIAVRRYIQSGGLYMVLYDTNSFAGPVASFLGCSPYQFAIRSSNIGFAGPGVIKETTGMDVPPNYHRCYLALSRGHIQGIWDRRDMRANLKQSLLTIGGSNLYYR